MRLKKENTATLSAVIQNSKYLILVKILTHFFQQNKNSRFLSYCNPSNLNVYGYFLVLFRENGGMFELLDLFG